MGIHAVAQHPGRISRSTPYPFNGSREQEADVICLSSHIPNSGSIGVPLNFGTPKVVLSIFKTRQKPFTDLCIGPCSQGGRS